LSRPAKNPVALRFNHVSVPARDLDVSETFYREVFGLERIPAPNFGFDVRWMRLGDLQLHLQTIDAEEPRLSYQHFGIEVDDFTLAYTVLRERGAFEAGTRYADLWLLPGGEIQMFVRDPFQNLIEVDCRDVAALDRSLLGDHLRVLEDEQPQGNRERAATLFLDADKP
jgi:catechol 2,3-dioxygenase-like lactoylglutathione lyase family enzyme